MDRSPFGRKGFSALYILLCLATLTGFALLAHGDLVVPSNSSGQFRRQRSNGNAPQLLSMRMANSYLVYEYEFDSDETFSRRSGVTSEDTTQDHSPGVGLHVLGSLYHPNLLTFDLAGEYSITKGEQEIKSTGSGENIKDDRDFDVRKFRGEVTFLKDKPYGMSLYAIQSEDQRDYDRFQSFNVDTLQYGARANHTRGRFPWDIDASHLEEDVDDPTQGSSRDENTVRFSMRHEAEEQGESRIYYSYEDYTQRDDDVPPFTGTTHAFDLANRTTWGKDDRFTLNSDLNLQQYEFNEVETRVLNLDEDFLLKHTDRHQSYSQYSVNIRDDDRSDSIQHRGEVGTRHWLYESLVSTLDFHGEYYENSGEGADDERYEYGPGIQEGYRKILGQVGRLTMDLSLDIERNEQRVEGETLQVVDEAVRLTDGDVALLDNPDVDQASIFITDTRSATRYIENRDYRILMRGRFTEIQRIRGGRIPNGSVVLVDYSSRADESDSSDSLEWAWRANIDLWDGLLWLYARLYNVDHSGDGLSVRFEDVSDELAGVRVSRFGAELGTEYQDYESESITYDAIRYYGRYLIPIGSASTLSFDASRTETSYSELDEDTNTDSYGIQLFTQPAQALQINLFGGQFYEESDTVDRDLNRLQLDVDFRMGKLLTTLRYRYEEENIQDEEDRTRQDFNIIVKRML